MEIGHATISQMRSKRGFTLLCISVAALSVMAAAGETSAVVVDDFNVGAITIVGPSVHTQTELDTVHVLSGSREMNVGQFGAGSVLEIEPANGLDFSSSDRGYFNIKYEFGSAGQGIDLTQGGQDRFRLIFGDMTNPSFTPLALYVTLPPNSSSHGISLSIGDWDGLILEFPFAAFPTSLTAAQNLTLDVSRNPPSASIVLRSITTASAPLAGDYNRDGIVDGEDYAVWRRFFGISTKNGLKFAIASADGDGNGLVNAADYVVWRKSLENSSTATSMDNQSLPEPAGILLLLTTLASCPLLLVRCRYR
jgi:hypothetical protein